MAANALATGQDRRRVMVLTGDTEAASMLEAELSALANVFLFAGVEQLCEAAPALPPHLLLLDLDAIDEQAREVAVAVEALQARFPGLPMLGLTRHRATAVRVRAKGVKTFLAPADPDELNAAVVSLMKGESGDSAVQVTTERSSLGQLIGTSEAMQRVYKGILRLADSKATVLIRGESGSGKELAARAIVSLGRRASKPFISLNCAALPESLIETELFGHERGAYTGADRAHPGQIELAHAGTLFLDEIATLTLSLQSKLLRVLEDREVRRIGGNTARSIDFRLITATNENLEELVRVGRFREDLYYRISVVPLDMPPLRDREGDIPLLIDHYMKHFCAAEGMPPKHFEPEAVEILEDYGWPGNVRELENLMQRLVLTVTGNTVELRHLPKNLLFASNVRQEALLIPEEGLDFDKEMGRIEAAYLRAALRRTDGVKKDAGKLLKLTPRQVKYLCHKHGL